MYLLLQSSPTISKSQEHPWHSSIAALAAMALDLLNFGVPTVWMGVLVLVTQKPSKHARDAAAPLSVVAVFGPQCIAPVAPLALRLLSRCSHSGSPPSSDILVLNRLASPFDVVCDDSPSDTDETDDTMQQKRSTHVDGGEGEIVGLFFHHDVGARRCPTLGDRPR
mmetsp:Transcript_9698/g.20700  ORF Transcript_9698/g.20700 Transcript_9698/m.20700 type:complete len:166 (-) Transcript_9698:68-565(-)